MTCVFFAECTSFDTLSHLWSGETSFSFRFQGWSIQCFFHLFIFIFFCLTDLLTTSLKIEASGNHSTDSFVSNDYLIHIENNGGNHGNRIAVKQFASSDNATFKASVFLRLSDVPRAVEYCNSPFKPVTGSEGTVNVQIFWTHYPVMFRVCSRNFFLSPVWLFLVPNLGHVS